MSLGITLPPNFQGVNATAEHYQRGLGSPQVSDSRFVDPNAATPDFSGSVRWSSSREGKGALPPLLVVEDHESFIPGWSNANDEDSSSRPQNAKKTVDDIVSLVEDLERTMRLQKSRCAWPLFVPPAKHTIVVATEAATEDRCGNAIANHSEDERSCLSISEGTVGAKRHSCGYPDDPLDDGSSTKGIHVEGEPSTGTDALGLPVDDDIDDSNVFNERRLSETEIEPASSTESNLIEVFTPLGANMEGIIGKLSSSVGKPPVNHSRRMLSPPWPEGAPGDEGRKYLGTPEVTVTPRACEMNGQRVLCSFEDCISALGIIKTTSQQLYRSATDELFEARHRIDTLEQRLSSLTKTHDLTVQRLIGANTKVSTTMAMLHQERLAMQSIMLRVGQAPPSPNAASQGDDLDDDELFGSPHKVGPTDAVEGVSPLRGDLNVISPGKPIPDQLCNAAAVAALMLPHEMANDVLKTRRQLQQYIRIIASLPSALKEHHDRIDRMFNQEWLVAATEEMVNVQQEKERIAESFRLRLEGEL